MFFNSPIILLCLISFLYFALFYYYHEFYRPFIWYRIKYFNKYIKLKFQSKIKFKFTIYHSKNKLQSKIIYKSFPIQKINFNQKWITMINGKIQIYIFHSKNYNEKWNYTKNIPFYRSPYTFFKYFKKKNSR